MVAIWEMEGKSKVDVVAILSEISLAVAMTTSSVADLEEVAADLVACP